MEQTTQDDQKDQSLADFMAVLQASREEIDRRIVEIEQRMKESEERYKREQEEKERLAIAYAERSKREQEEYEQKRKRKMEEQEEYEKQRKLEKEGYEKQRKSEREEYDKQRKLKQEEYDKQRKVENEEYEKQRKLVQEEYERQRKERDDLLEKKLSKFGNRLGEIVEAMIRPNLLAKFKALGLEFDKISREVEIRQDNQFLTEIDAFMENGDSAMVVEVKSKPSVDDIKEHIERMAKLRSYADRRGDKRKYFGAVGGMVFNENEREFSLKCGFYVIIPSGETFDIIAPSGKYQPRIW